jgi:hypothetical protein
MELPARRKRGGRPRKREIKPGDRVALNVRVTPELKKWIDRASEASGHSQSQEVELRLTRAMEREGLLFEALTLRHGRKGAAVMLVASDALRVLERLVGHLVMSEGGSWPDEHWLDDPRCYRTVVDAIVSVAHDLDPASAGITKVPQRAENSWEHVGAFAAHVAMIATFRSDSFRHALPGQRTASSDVQKRPKPKHDDESKTVPDEVHAYWFPKLRKAEAEVEAAKNELDAMLKAAPAGVRKKLIARVKRGQA